MRQANILLVDDQRENLLMLEALLEEVRPALHFVKANCGEQALKAVLEHDFAVILLDVHMPGMDGFETAGLIKQREKSQFTPIVFLTAYDDGADHVFRGYTVGVVDYLVKPVVPRILQAK